MQSKSLLVLNRNFVSEKVMFLETASPIQKTAFGPIFCIIIDTIARKPYANTEAYFRTCVFVILIIISNFPRYLISHYSFLTDSHSLVLYRTRRTLSLIHTAQAKPTMKTPTLVMTEEKGNIVEI